MSLQGHTLLITGAARRVGRSIALAAAGAGANVIIHYGQSLADAVSLRDDIRRLGQQAELLQADLSDPREVSELLPRALKLAPVDLLVNNASIFEPLTWDQTRLEDWNQHLMVNLTAPFLLSQALARGLKPSQNGRILNLLDWRALRPGADHLPYTISKAALAALTQSLAVALAPQITVNGLALGAILPPSDGGINEEILAAVPAGRWARMDEVDQAALFLLDGPAYITGEIIHLDGGRHLI
jgi:NAD(P)-dependent dehydrogenase (short-subunit alcohol dehydrogenase family)